jgi:hypothetical protein
MEKFHAHTFVDLIRIAAELDSMKATESVTDERRPDLAACT